MDSDFALTRSLNRLIAALNDTIGACEAIARDARRFALYAKYEHEVALRRDIVRRLTLRVAHLGGEPRRRGTLGGWLERLLVRLGGIGLRGERCVLRLFRREERHLAACLRALVAEDGLPPAFRRELALLLLGLNEAFCRRELDRFGPRGAWADHLAVGR
ncbi:DUF2383 domain-containing protein [Sphingomonas histidinilytica]|jgi:uncharacterized protein (TIGR02284 family)|uniref:DUF2383 domain-containing protein n=1 Tax=Rhizorhabdus histidinilytica TaxID=439228 RepID=A0A1T4ZY21_9SPHN|nr:DUF2383 domain-containing protein [Rhizorhabdus histidinilytica]MBO9375973.1 DUF2383 domain-containing protein [Rhizorhabdus histidinilytica]QEH78512.1 DUF2383 domain-containing protein [Sphingomonas sp. C8-2]SKB27612.1 conserved hypothetical protein [Rhizorhabdus histidinilytica]